VGLDTARAFTAANIKHRSKQKETPKSVSEN
jgi:hypothetical protein